MKQCGWEDCPPRVRHQAETLVDGFVDALGTNLVGVYLHGSLAMGCFNPDRSDIDLLVVTHEGMNVAVKRRIAELLLRHSNALRPVEVSFVHWTQLHPWRYPTSFDLHYSEDWRDQTARELAGDGSVLWSDAERYDADLAAHTTITLARGIALRGLAPSDVFLPVPCADYLDSIWGDVEQSPRWIGDQPVYGVLNLCRVYAYVRDGLICSKDEGATWALRAVAAEHHMLIEQALRAYRGEENEDEIDAGRARAFAHDMLDEITRYRR